MSANTPHLLLLFQVWVWVWVWPSGSGRVCTFNFVPCLGSYTSAPTDPYRSQGVDVRAW